MQREVVVVGGIPEPIGGVTNFIYRLAKRHNLNIEAIIDLYDTGNKVELTGYDGGYHLLSGKISKLASLIKLLCRYQDKIIFWNFSRAYSFLLLLFMPKFSQGRWALMLHHGSLEMPSILKRFVINTAISFAKNRVDIALALNKKQVLFYKQHGFKNVIETTSYLPCSLDSHKYPYIEHTISDLRRRGKKILIASGFPRKIYNHLWLINFARDNHVALLLFLYGNGESMTSLTKACGQVDDCYLFYGCSEACFNSALSGADVYVRPNDVDSFGIACADAISVGTRVLASDVCPRYKGCAIYKHNYGYISFSEALKRILSDSGEIFSLDCANQDIFSVDVIFK